MTLVRLNASLSNYLALLGEPTPLLGTIAMQLVNMIDQSDLSPSILVLENNNLDNMTILILEATILGIVERLEGLNPRPYHLLLSIKSCLDVTKQLSLIDRCDIHFKVIGMALKGLSDLTKIKYPSLLDGNGNKLIEEVEL